MVKRENEFRGKRVLNDEWIYGYYKYSRILNEHIIICDEDCVSYTVIPETVDQITWLEDRDGVDIYEGDIVSSEELIIYSIGQARRSNNIGVVRRDIKNGCLVINNDNGQTKRLTAKVIKENRVQVIGNIYENPELLRKKK